MAAQLKKIRNLEAVFSPNSIAVIGASREPNKIGHVIVKNFVDGGFGGKVYPINQSADTILGLKAYKSVLDIREKVDSAVIAVPMEKKSACAANSSISSTTDGNSSIMPITGFA